MLLPGASGPAGEGETTAPTHPGSTATKGHPTPSEKQDAPEPWDKPKDRAKARASAHRAAIPATPGIKLLPRCGQEGGTQAPGLAPPRALRPANTRLFARWMNLSAMLCPSYVRKLEPAAAERLLPAVPCPKRSAGAEASPEVSPVLPVLPLSPCPGPDCRKDGL